MLSIIMFATLIFVGLKMIPVIFKLTWEIAKIVCTFLLLPLIIIGLIYVGLVCFAVPVLVILGLAILVGYLAKA